MSTTGELVTIQIVDHEVPLPIAEPGSKQKKPQSAVWYYWVIKKKGASRDLDVVACKKCGAEYVRRAYRCVKHTSRCYSILSNLLNSPAWPINPETGEAVEPNADGTLEGMENVQLMTVIEGQTMVITPSESVPLSEPLRRKYNRMQLNPIQKANRLSNKLKGREQNIRDLRKEMITLQRKINEQTEQLHSKDLELNEIKSNYDQMKVDHAKLVGKLEETENWKDMLADVMSMAQTVITHQATEAIE